MQKQFKNLISAILFLQIFLGTLLLEVKGHIHTTDEEIKETVAKKIVYYGSTVRLQNQGTYFYLHSHDVSYGTGSRQQSVTGIKVDSDYNSLWTIKNPYNGPMKTYKDEVLCGQVIRLEHMLTNKNLHSHKEFSPVSKQQEVSAYGQDGDGDEGDDWILECINQDIDTPMKGLSPFYLVHKLSKKFLQSSLQHTFNRNNCGRQCPIEGQLEIAANDNRNTYAEWKIVGGLFYEKKLYDNEFNYDDDDSSNENQNNNGDGCLEGGPDDEGYTVAKVFKEDL